MVFGGEGISYPTAGKAPRLAVLPISPLILFDARSLISDLEFLKLRLDIDAQVILDR